MKWPILQGVICFLIVLSELIIKYIISFGWFVRILEDL
jgi:hypothetical protein